MSRALGLVSALVAAVGFFSSSLAFAFAHPDVKIGNSTWSARGPHEIVLHEYDRSRPPTLSFENPERISKCAIDSKPCPGLRDVPIFPERLELEQKIVRIDWREGGVSRSISITVFVGHETKPKIEGRSSIDSTFVFAIGNNLCVLAADGAVEFFRRFPKPVIDFRPFKIAGRTYYSFAEIHSVNEELNSMGRHHVLDRNFRTIATHDEVVDTHEFLVVNPGHYVYVDYAAKTGPDGKCRLRRAIVESKDGRVIHSLDSDQLLEAGILPPYRGGVKFDGRDCLENGHLNGIQIVDANRWLVSFGDYPIFMWLKKERKAEWIMGGPADQFGLTAAQATSLHHTPTWIASERRLVVYDNGQATKKGRLLDYVLDVRRKKIESMKALDLGLWSASGGNVTHEGASRSVATGRWKTRAPDFLEYAEDRKVLSMSFEGPHPHGVIYRMYRGPRP